MATPITHIAITQKVFDRIFSEKSKKEFYIGTSFPDIRYLWVIERDITHFDLTPLCNFENYSSFEAGLRFHSNVDIIRENFMIENNLYKLCPNSKYIKQSVKVLEDIIFYDFIDDWSSVISYFDDKLSYEMKYWIDDIYIGRWHQILQKYFSNRPNSISIKNFIQDIGLSWNVADEINLNIDLIKTNEQILNILRDFYYQFDV